MILIENEVLNAAERSRYSNRTVRIGLSKHIFLDIAYHTCLSVYCLICILYYYYYSITICIPSNGEMPGVVSTMLNKVAGPLEQDLVSTMQLNQ